MAPADAQGNVTLDCTPTAKIDAGSCGVSYQPTLVSPVLLTLGGTTPDSSGNLNILVGQSCTASLTGIPSGGGWSVTYQWSVSGPSVARRFKIGNRRRHKLEPRPLIRRLPTLLAVLAL